MGDIERLHIGDLAEAVDLAVDGEASGFEHGLPGIFLGTSHIVVGVVAGDDHQRAQHDIGIARSLDGLDDSLAGGLFRLTLDGADEDVLITELLHLGVHLAVGDLGDVRGAVAHEDERGARVLRGVEALKARIGNGRSGDRLGNGFLVGVDNGGVGADLAEHRLRDGEKIDNMDQALERAVANGVKNLVVQPTHLMHGAEYDEMCEAIEAYKDQFESVSIAEPMLGEVGSDATVINADKEAVAKAITAAAVSEAGFESLEAAKDAGTAFVFMGHGTAHVAKVTYSQMQTQMQNLGYENVFIGTVEGEPEETSAEAVIEAVKAAGYTNVVLRPLMVVAGDHANNDMAGSDDDSWKTVFEAAGFTVDCQIHGLGEIADVQALYVAHTKAAIDALNA